MRVEDRLSSRRSAFSPKMLKTNQRMRSSPFYDVFLREQLSSATEEIDDLLFKLDEQSKRLVLSRTFADLHHYKKIVRQILERTVGDAVRLTEKHTTDGHGRSRIYHLVKEVNAELVQLTEAILEREQDQLRILDKIGQIKGLLIQLKG